MKKLILFFLLVSSFAYSQTQYVPSKITFNSGKVMDTKIIFLTNRFHRGFLDEYSITDVYVKTGDKGLRYVKYPASTIKKIEFVDLQHNPRVFKSVPDYSGLVEVKFDGKIDWYRTFSHGEYANDTQIGDYLQKGDKKIVLSLFSNNKTNLKELTSDKPELASLIDELNFNNFKDKDLLEVLKKYNE